MTTETPASEPAPMYEAQAQRLSATEPTVSCGHEHGNVPLASECAAAQMRREARAVNAGGEHRRWGVVRILTRADGCDERRPMLFVNEYARSRAYGGPEEGGWWYDHGRFVACHGEFTDRKAADERLGQIAARLPSGPTGDGDEARELRIDMLTGEDYPAVTPWCA